MDVLAVGNAMIDAFMQIQEGNMSTQIDEKNHMLCFRYGQKIHVDSCQFLPGGNACNVSVGLGRQGLSVGLCAEIGDDEFADKLIKKLSEEPVDLSLLKQKEHAASSFSVGIDYKHERTLFVQHVHREHDFNLAGVDTTWFYLTSLGVEWKAAYASVVAHVTEKGTKLAFSPGTHQMEEGREPLEAVLRVTDILFLNKEEAQRLLSSDSSDEKELLEKLQDLGPKIVSLTDGGKGAFALSDEKKMYAIGVFPQDMVGRTGAGDAYASGFLGAIVMGKSLPEAMRCGAINAAAVIGKIGSQAGLLLQKELEEQLAAHPEFVAKEMV